MRQDTKQHCNSSTSIPFSRPYTNTDQHTQTCVHTCMHIYIHIFIDTYRVSEKVVSDFGLGGGFHRVLWFPPPFATS